MESSDEPSVNWADLQHGVIDYQNLDPTQSSFDGSSTRQFAGLQSLQGVFVTIQPPTDEHGCQQIHNDVAYQSVYMPGTTATSFERISPDGMDYGVTTDEDDIQLDVKQQFIQVEKCTIIYESI